MRRLNPISKTKPATNMQNLSCFTVLQALEEPRSVLLKEA